MTLGKESVIQECMDGADSVPTIKYELIPFAQIAKKTGNDTVGKQMTQCV